MNIIKIGERLKYARTLRNYTLEYIASDIGVAKSTIQRYENSLISNPKIPVLRAIANSLKVNPTWLMGSDVPMELDQNPKEWWPGGEEELNKEHAFKQQLKALGWEYELCGCDEKEGYYLFSSLDDKSSFRVSCEDFDLLMNETEMFLRKRLRKLLLKSAPSLSDNLPIAAHERTDIEVTDEMRQHDEDIMNDNSEWE